ncbi:MAG TPA: oxygenase MpaB family protein [Chloroflexota bacterium]|nr:oxygenase MpaB family protein [Chloroflexota bacterium]
MSIVSPATPQSRSGDSRVGDGLAGPESVAWKINREVVLLVGWGRAILLQVAHPMVAQGVADHSLFVKSPHLRRQRLQQTLSAMLALTFGTREEVEAAARGINAIHDHVRGELREAVGTHPAGARYSAHDPALLRWVHATLLESFPLAYRTFIGPLSDEEVERYCREASGLAPLLGIPEGYLPTSVAEARAYVREMMASGEIAVGETARQLASELLNPHLQLPSVVRLLLWPFLWLGRLPAIGMLPPEIRRQYGFSWRRRHEVALRVVAATSRCVLPHLPPLLRHWPAARRAMERRRQYAER